MCLVAENTYLIHGSSTLYTNSMCKKESLVLVKAGPLSHSWWCHAGVGLFRQLSLRARTNSKQIKRVQPLDMANQQPNLLQNLPVLVVTPYNFMTNCIIHFLVFHP